MKTLQTFYATIYVGFKEHYDGKLHTIEEAEKICQDYCDEIGLCVTLIPTRYIYTHGNEEGCAIGLINYPRFPSDSDVIKNRAVELGRLLRKNFNQYKVTVVTTTETIMIEDDD